MIPFKINDQEVEAQEGWTVLETAKQYGIRIPTLCYHEALSHQWRLPLMRSGG